jgi:phage gp36-like protein
MSASAYCQQADILGEISYADLVTLTDDDTPPTGDINTEILNQTIANASGLIDRMVGNIYSLPFSPIPPSVTSLAVTITCYRLLRRREVPDEKNKFADDYKLAMRMLERVNTGEQHLDLSVNRDFSQVAANVTSTPFGYGNIPASTK